MSQRHLVTSKFFSCNALWIFCPSNSAIGVTGSQTLLQVDIDSILRFEVLVKLGDFSIFAFHYLQKFLLAALHFLDLAAQVSSPLKSESSYRHARYRHSAWATS